MDYETLDAIADSYIPALAVLLLIGLLHRCYMDWPRWRATASIFAFSLCLLVVSYALMFVDNAMQLWPRFGLDYSTHTAVSLVLVISLCLIYPKRKILLIATFVGYAALMLYQKYHSIADILSTAGIIIILSIPIYKKIISLGCCE